MKKLITIFWLSLFCVAATAQMRFISTNGEDIRLKHVRNKTERRVKVFLTPEEVPADAERIGILIGNYRNEQKALLTAKNFAAQAGGEAILIVSTQDPKTGEKIAATALNIAGLPGAGNFRGKYYYLVYRLKDYSLYYER